MIQKTYRRAEPADPVVRQFYHHHKRDNIEALQRELEYYRDLSRIAETHQVTAAITALERLIREAKPSIRPKE